MHFIVLCTRNKDKTQDRDKIENLHVRLEYTIKYSINICRTQIMKLNKYIMSLFVLNSRILKPEQICPVSLFIVNSLIQKFRNIQIHIHHSCLKKKKWTRCNIAGFQWIYYTLTNLLLPHPRKCWIVWIIHVNYDTSSFLELCLTSNVKCGTVESYKKHHFIHLFTAKHPIVLAVSIDKRNSYSVYASQSIPARCSW